MKFYRRLSPIKAISFDLDDTLYSNGPVMAAIEQKMVAYFAKLLPEHSQVFDTTFWFAFKKQAIKQHNDLAHDVVIVRYESYRLGLLALGKNDAFADKHAKAALDYFIALRSDFSVPEQSIQLLECLSKRYPLAAISNGNVDTNTLGISKYFQQIYHAGYQQREGVEVVKSSLLKHKPAQDMFAVVCQNLAIEPHELLHVGDCGNADIFGALTAGCQTAYLPKYGVGKALKQLPHIELACVSDLTRLV